MTYRRLVTMGTRTTRSGGRRLLAATLLSSMTMVALSFRDVSALTLQECHERGGMVDGRGNCSYTAKDGKIVIEPVVGARAQSGAIPAPPPQGTPKPLTPGITKTPPLAQRQADLIAVSRSQSVPKFCEWDRAGKFLIHVKNQGLAAAPVSRVALFFPKVSKTLFGPTHSLSPGAETTVAIDIPAGILLAGDNSFTITVDFDNSVPESPAGETNNKVDSKCIG